MRTIAEHLIWIIVIIIIIAWFYFRNLTEQTGQMILFWAPTIVLVVGFIIAITSTKLRNKIDAKQGITFYEIIIYVSELYLFDLIVYGGTLLILLAAKLFNDNGITVVDLLQSLIYYLLAGAIRQIIYKKTQK